MKNSTKKICAKPHPPFFSDTKRFTFIGLHPQLDKDGFFKKKITDAGPGTYDAKFISCYSKQPVSWSRKLDTEEYSKYHGYHNLATLEEKIYQQSLGGPAVQEINMNLFKRQNDSKKEDVGLGMTQRFVDVAHNVPPPNTYHRKPHQLDTLLRKSICKTQLFEADGFIDRFQNVEPNYRVPPNIYDVTKCDGKNTADIINKKVSQKGPYNLFTGPRDGSTIKSYFAPTSFKSPDQFYVKPTDLDRLLHHKSKANTGRFLKCRRFLKKPTLRHILDDLSMCYKDPTEPGPAYYKIERYKSITKKPETLCPFDKCNAQSRPPPAKWTIFPGPGRYNPKYSKCMKQKRLSWVFLSSSSRTNYEPPDYRAF